MPFQAGNLAGVGRTVDRYHPASGLVAPYGSAEGLPEDWVSALYVDKTAVPRALFVTAGDSVAIYRGP